MVGNALTYLMLVLATLAAIAALVLPLAHAFGLI